MQLQLTEKAVIHVKITVMCVSSCIWNPLWKDLYCLLRFVCCQKIMSTNLEQQVAAGGSLTYDFFWQHTNLNKHWRSFQLSQNSSSNQTKNKLLTMLNSWLLTVISER